MGEPSLSDSVFAERNEWRDSVMKQELSPEHRVALIQYRFERAYKTLEEADYMRVGNYFNAAINRLYYTCFYAAIGLLNS